MQTLSSRTLVLLLAMYTAAMAIVIMMLALLIAGHGNVGTKGALELAAPFVLLLCAVALLAGFFATRLLRQGREKRAMACACAYAALPWPVITALLY